MKRSLTVTSLLALCSVAIVATASAGYPPTVTPPSSKIVPQQPPAPNSPASLIFANTHNYGSVIIDVRIFNNYFGDGTKYWWTYTVSNLSFDPTPGSSNGFSGFELNLPVSVPDIADISPLAPWIINGFSGAPVEWDLRNSGGLGVMPGDIGDFSFTTSPRLISVSSGWFHTWESEVQTFVTNYPPDNSPEVPNVLEPIVPVQPTSWGHIKSLYND
jgi:hypothetical protein